MPTGTAQPAITLSTCIQITPVIQQPRQISTVSQYLRHVSGKTFVVQLNFQRCSSPTSAAGQQSMKSRGHSSSWKGASMDDALTWLFVSLWPAEATWGRTCMQEAYRKVPPLAHSHRATATGLEAPGKSTCAQKGGKPHLTIEEAGRSPERKPK